MTSSIDYPSLDPSINMATSDVEANKASTRSNNTAQLNLAQALKARSASQSIPGWSGFSTPNNSPDSLSPEGSPPSFFYGPLELLQEGAKMIRRTWNGEETPVPRTLPRISRKELEVCHYFLRSILKNCT